MQAGDRLSNGAILLDETVYLVEKHDGSIPAIDRYVTHSIVIAMLPGNRNTPYVTWDRRQDSSDNLDSMAMGHYHRFLKEAWAEYSERSEKHTHIEANKKAIIKRATDDGKARASWFVNPDWDYAMTRRWFEALDQDVDPEIEDQLPRAPLGGEWADDPTWADIFTDECVTPNDDPIEDYPQYQELEDLYVDTYNQAARDEIVDWLAKRLEAFDLEDD